jgi:hypothetical protein
VIKPKTAFAILLVLGVLFLLVQSCDASIVVAEQIDRPNDLCLVGAITEFLKTCGVDTCTQDSVQSDAQMFHYGDGFGFTYSYQPPDEWDFFSVSSGGEEFFFENSGLFYTAFFLDNCAWDKVEYWKSCEPTVKTPEPSSALIWLAGMLFWRRR